jgi:hypothetical protein
VRAKLPLLLSLAALLLLAVLAARGGSAVPAGQGLVLGHLTKPQHATQIVQPHNVPTGINPVLGVGLASAIAIGLLVFLACIVVAVLLLTTLRWRRRRRSRDRAAQPGTDDIGAGGEVAMALLRGTRSALQRLHRRTGGPPSDAVQEAWLALESAAQECGTARRPEQTSTEFTTALLAAHDVDPTALATLRGLYQRARFGRPDSVTEADATAAIAALERIAEGLTGAVPA